jgi:SOS-response transcriptional repressor LexA
MQETLDPIDEMLLVQVNDGASTEEMTDATGIRSTSTVQSKLVALEVHGWITPARRTKRGAPAARSRRLTPKAWEYLNERGLVSDRRDPGAPAAA